MFTVTISDKGGQQSRLEFNKSEISIGRMKGNDIVLPKGNVSKRHASIYVRDDAFYVNDTAAPTAPTSTAARSAPSSRSTARTGSTSGTSSSSSIRSGCARRPARSARRRQPAQHHAPDAPRRRPWWQRLGRTGSGEVEGNRVGNDTIFDPFGGDGPQADPLRQTFTTPPLLAEQARTRLAMAAPTTMCPRARATPSAPTRSSSRSAPRPGASSTPCPTSSESAPPSQPSSGEREREPHPLFCVPLGVLPLLDRSSSAPKPERQEKLAGPRSTRPAAILEPAPRAAARRLEPVTARVEPAADLGRVERLALQVQAPEVLQEFDSDFFVAQLDVARVLFEDHPIEQMP